MSAPSTPASQLGWDVLYVATASIGSSLLFSVVLEQYAEIGVWEWCVANSPLAGMIVFTAASALVCGIAFGFALGVIAGNRAVRLAAWTGLIVCVLHSLNAALVGGVQWALTNIMLGAPVFTAVGLLLGAVLGRKLRRA